jgi:hypothetical protein
MMAVKASASNVVMIATGSRNTPAKTVPIAESTASHALSNIIGICPCIGFS